MWPELQVHFDSCYLFLSEYIQCLKQCLALSDHKVQRESDPETQTQTSQDQVSTPADKPDGFWDILYKVNWEERQ